MNAQSKVEAANVYQAIAAVQGQLAKVGIAKSRRNTQGAGYNFRGIDDVYAALAPLLAEHGLCVIPRVIERETVERTSRKGDPLFFVTVKAEFDFVSVADGSTHTCCTYGEAMDSGDKATNKAMSAAYKYAAFMTFAIPTEGDNDADAHTHDVAPAAAIPADTPAPDEPAPRQKLEGKHSSKTALATALRAYGLKISNAATTREVDAIVDDYAEDLEQARRYLPKWMDGDPTQDSKGLVRLTAERRQLLELIEQVRLNQTRKALDAWYGQYEAEIETLDDGARREFDAAFEAHEAGLKLITTVNAG